jgi:SanA protein
MTRVLAVAAALVIAAVAIPNLVVWLGGRSPVTADPARVPHAQAALVLGAQVKPDGSPSAMLADRVRAAEDLRGDAEGRR